MKDKKDAKKESTFEKVGFKKGKYLVKFPFLKIPVEMNEKLYHIFLKKQKAQSK